MTLPPLSSAERGRPCRPHERKGPAFTFATSRVGLECCDTSAARSRRPSRRCWAAALPRAAGRIDARAPAGAHLRLGRQFSADAAAPAHQLPASVFRTLFLRPRCKSLWRRGFATPYRYIPHLRICDLCPVVFGLVCPPPFSALHSLARALQASDPVLLAASLYINATGRAGASVLSGNLPWRHCSCTRALQLQLSTTIEPGHSASTIC